MCLISHVSSLAQLQVESQYVNGVHLLEICFNTTEGEEANSIQVDLLISGASPTSSTEIINALDEFNYTYVYEEGSPNTHKYS